MKKVIVILGVVFLSGGVANADDAKIVCGTAALNDYIRAGLSLNSLSVETLIAKRRLEEQFCLRFAQCALGGVQGQMPLAAEFSKCLEDEAMEKYHAVPSKNN
jgi:hypothetical protein